MPHLNSSIQSLAESFATSVIQAIRASSLQDILRETSGGKAEPARPAGKRGPGRPPSASSGRLQRRSEKDITAVADRIVAFVKQHKEGRRAEQIRAELGIDKKEWARPLEDRARVEEAHEEGREEGNDVFREVIGGRCGDPSEHR
jgi:hypothetical protein